MPISVQVEILSFGQAGTDVVDVGMLDLTPEVTTDANAVPVTIDWNGSADSEFMSQPVVNQDWLAGFLGLSQVDTRSLGEITGLVVRIDK